MELRNPFQVSPTPKASAQPKLAADNFIARLISDRTQEMQPHELGDNEADPDLKELQHRIYMLEQQAKQQEFMIMSVTHVLKKRGYL